MDPTFEIAHYEAWAIMRVTGEIDMATAPLLRQHVQNVTGTKPEGLVLDLDRVEFIDSTGLGVLVGAAKRMRVNEGHFRIVCAQPHLSELFALTRLNEVFEIHQSLESALADARRADAK